MRIQRLPASTSETLTGKRARVTAAWIHQAGICRNIGELGARTNKARPGLAEDLDSKTARYG